MSVLPVCNDHDHDDDHDDAHDDAHDDDHEDDDNEHDDHEDDDHDDGHDDDHEDEYHEDNDHEDDDHEDDDHDDDNHDEYDNLAHIDFAKEMDSSVGDKSLSALLRTHYCHYHLQKKLMCFFYILNVKMLTIIACKKLRFLNSLFIIYNRLSPYHQ